MLPLLLLSARAKRRQDPSSTMECADRGTLCTNDTQQTHARTSAVERAAASHRTRRTEGQGCSHTAVRIDEERLDLVRSAGV